MDGMDFTYYNDNLYKLKNLVLVKFIFLLPIKNYTQVFDIVSKLL